MSLKETNRLDFYLFRYGSSAVSTVVSGKVSVKRKTLNIDKAIKTVNHNKPNIDARIVG